MSTTKGNGGSPPGTTPADANHNTTPPATTAVYAEVQDSEDFGQLRRTFRRFAFPMTVGFCAWYFLYVLMSNYATGFMGKVVFGNVNVAFVFGVLQFVSTFAIAWLYSSFAGKKLDEQAARLKAEVEDGVAAATERTEAVR